MATMKQNTEKSKEKLFSLLQQITIPNNNNNNNSGNDLIATECLLLILQKERNLMKEFLDKIILKLSSNTPTEVLKTLDLLNECMFKCGSAFQREIGRFHFLNELLRLVLPNHKGLKTTIEIKNKILQLLNAWRLQYPHEEKINEAYEMLLKADVKYDPLPNQFGDIDQRCLTGPTSLSNDQFNQIPKKLLVSKDPKEVEAANLLIKQIVRENENKLQLTSEIRDTLRKSLDNGNLLNEMLKEMKPNHLTEDEEDTLKELYRTCKTLKSTVSILVYNERLSSNLIDDILATNDLLNDVCKEYLNKRLEIDEIVMSTQDSHTPNNVECQPAQSIDLAPSLTNTELLTDIFNASSTMVSTYNSESNPIDNPPTNSTTDILSQPNFFPSNMIELGILQPIESPVQSKKEIARIDDENILCNDPSSTLSLQADNGKSGKMQSSLDKDVEEMVAKLKVATSKTTKQMTKDNPILNDAFLEDLSVELNELKINVASNVTDTMEAIKLTTPTNGLTMMDNDQQPLSKLSSIDINKIKPSTDPPRMVYNDPNGLKIMFHFSADHPKENVSIIVVNTTNQSPKSISKYQFDASVSKPCKIHLLEASSKQLSGIRPFGLQAESIYQIILISTVNKSPFSLTCIVTYCIEDELDPIKESIYVENLN